MQTIKRTLTDVIRFLDEKECLADFLINGGKFDHEPTLSLITESFCWIETPQGGDYWNDIDDAYRKWFLKKTYDKFDLYRFLEAKGALTNYLKNAKREPENPKVLIYGAFYWNDTEQGFHYWYALNREWISIVSNDITL